MRIPVRAENGWQIDAILDTTYEATKDGESVTLEADTLEQMELLIALREGNVKHEDQPRATITMPDSFRCVPAVDVKPVAEIINAVEEAIRVLNAINSRGNERFDYADYCELHDAISAICPNCGADMREAKDDER